MSSPNPEPSSNRTLPGTRSPKPKIRYTSSRPDLQIHAKNSQKTLKYSLFCIAFDTFCRPPAGHSPIFRTPATRHFLKRRKQHHTLPHHSPTNSPNSSPSDANISPPHTPTCSPQQTSNP